MNNSINNIMQSINSSLNETIQVDKNALNSYESYLKRLETFKVNSFLNKKKFLNETIENICPRCSNGLQNQTPFRQLSVHDVAGPIFPRTLSNVSHAQILFTCIANQLIHVILKHFKI